MAGKPFIILFTGDCSSRSHGNKLANYFKSHHTTQFYGEHNLEHIINFLYKEKFAIIFF